MVVTLLEIQPARVGAIVDAPVVVGGRISFADRIYGGGKQRGQE